MNISEPFIRRPVMTVLVMCSIIFFGFTAYKALPVSDLPNIDMPTIEVSVSYPGANPDTMANSVATPLEQQFMTIEGIESIFSTSNTGSSTIILQFNLNRNIDSASTDVQAAITAALPNLPADLPNNPTYQKVNPAATPILYFAILAPNMTQGELYDFANTFIGQRLAMVDGVSKVLTYGAPYAVRVQVDPEKLAAKNIGLDEVTASIQNQNVDLSLGTLWGPSEDFTIETDGQLMNAAGYSEIVIKNEKGDLVKIADIGRALDSVQNDKFFMRYITKEKDRSCIVIAIQKLAGKNTVQIIDGIDEKLKAITPQLPKSLSIERMYDQSESIKEGVKDVELTLIVAFFLVVAIIYLILGKALNTIIPAIALPLAILGTFAIMLPLGFSVDILSLLALTLSIGFLVDDAIVVLENNVRHVQLSEEPFDAAINSSKEISVTVMSMTICLIAAFIPMIFMGGVIGRLFREFAITLIIAVLVSGFVSLSLTPMLGSKFIKPYAKQKKTKMEQFSDRVNEKMLKLYEPCLKWAMKYRLLTLSSGLFCILGSFALFKAIPMDFLPSDDVGFIQGYTLARDGTSPYLMEKYHKEISQIAIEDSNVNSIISVSSFNNPNEGILFFQLKAFKDRLPMSKVVHELSEKFHQIPGVNAFLSPLPLINLQVGTTAQALYQYSLTSIDQKELYKYAPKLTREIKNNPAFSQVSSDLRINQPEWSLHIDRDKASNYGINANKIESYFGYAYSDNKISQINADINQYDVLIETLPEFYRDPTVFSKLYVRSNTNALVPLSEILTPKESVGPLTVNHINGLPAVNISFNPGLGVPLGTMLNTLNTLSEKDSPPQVHGQLIGTANVYQKSFDSLKYLMVLAFFVIYIVLGILYESFIHPLTVMSSLPPALFGGLLTLWIFQETLSIYSFVGLIMLIGIVLKNGILMIDFANHKVHMEKKNAYDAIHEAALTRFRPIIMTTVAAGMGAVPIALGIGGAMAQSRISLGLCIVGGLIISQILTLLLTPVIYYYFELLQEKLLFWTERKN